MIKNGFLIDGKSLAEQFLAKLKQQIKTYKSKVKEIPKLAIIFVGDDPASNIYVKNKMNKAKEVVRAITGLGLKEAKDLVESAPAKVKEGVAKADAEETKTKLEEAGAVVELK